jgi:hypothetical protein
MLPLILSLMLTQAAPGAAAEAPPPPPAATPAETLQGLEQVYSTTCGQTGILYHAYDDLCEGLRKQIAAYRQRIEREARADQAKAASPRP